MSRHQQQQQHKVATEEKTRNKLLADVKRENQHLRRKVSRLQKQLAQVLEHVTEAEVDEAEGLHVVLPACPECASTELTKLDVFDGVLWVCKSCKWRKKDNNVVKTG